MSVLPEPNETLDDVLSFCAKIWEEHEVSGKVLMDDLSELRALIESIEKHVSKSPFGYPSIPRLVKPEGT